MPRPAWKRWPACSAASRSPTPRAATPRKCCKTPAPRVNLPGGRRAGRRPRDRRRMEEPSGKTGLVLAGGGARAAYQVGVLQAIREIVPDTRRNPFPIICGTSAGAVNAGALAVHADDFGRAVENLLEVWRNFEPRHVYRADFIGVFANSSKWFASLLFGALMKNKPVSLLDNRPLANLLGRKLDFTRIERNIASGALDAVSITCSGYTSGQSCSFFEGAATLDGWKRSARIGIKAKIQVGHLMASSAIPFLFPAHHLNREFFGDGSM